MKDDQQKKKKKELICVNPKCDKEVGAIKHLFHLDGREMIVCSDACYMFSSYNYFEGIKKSTATKYLQDLHPRWFKLIKPFLDKWEIKIGESTNIEEEINNAIIKTIEEIKKKYVELN